MTNLLNKKISSLRNMFRGDTIAIALASTALSVDFCQHSLRRRRAAFIADKRNFPKDENPDLIRYREKYREQLLKSQCSRYDLLAHVAVREDPGLQDRALRLFVYFCAKQQENKFDSELLVCYEAMSQLRLFAKRKTTAEKLHDVDREARQTAKRYILARVEGYKQILDSEARLAARRRVRSINEKTWMTCELLPDVSELEPMWHECVRTLPVTHSIFRFPKADPYTDEIAVTEIDTLRTLYFLWEHLGRGPLLEHWPVKPTAAPASEAVEAQPSEVSI